MPMGAVALMEGYKKVAARRAAQGKKGVAGAFWGLYKWKFLYVPRSPRPCAPFPGPRARV